MSSPARVSSLATLFWRHVEPTPDDVCWIWRGAKTGTGYGHTRVGGRRGSYMTSNRMSWEVHHGPIPAGMHVLHHCDVKLCCRPDHLYLGTRTDNLRDAMNRGRIRSGERHGMARLRNRDVRSIREATGTDAQIARTFAVSRATIYRIRTGKGWGSVA